MAKGKKNFIEGGAERMKRTLVVREAGRNGSSIFYV